LITPLHRRYHRRSEFGQCVFDSRWYFGVDGATDETVGLEFAQLAYQDSRVDWADESTQFAETLSAAD
jgi:hypothetical protein